MTDFWKNGVPTWFWCLMVIGACVSAYLWANNFHLFDTSLGITLAIVEVPLALIGSIIIRTILNESREQAKLNAEAIEKVQDRSRRIAMLDENIKNHEETMLPVFQTWLPNTEQIPNRMRYLLNNRGVYFLQDADITIRYMSETNLPTERQVKDVIGHLRSGYPNEWDKWTILKDKINNNFKEIADLWTELKDAVDKECQKQSLQFYDSPTINEEYYILDLIIQVWNNIHLSVEQINNIWQIELGGGSSFRLSNFVVSKNAKKLETIKTFCLNETDRLRSIVIKLENEKRQLEYECLSFTDFLRLEIKDAYKLRSKPIAGECETCKSWKHELEELSK